VIVLPTIDVEGVHGDRPFEQMILGEVGDKETWGVFRLARTFQRFGVSATFFVDCYEHTLWGEEKMRRVCQQLAEMGQDVQLHTHPAWRDDPRDAAWLREHKRRNSFLTPERDFMAKLSLEEQIAVLEAGIDLFERWLGRRPIAHRSGGYSINADTISALRHTGIAIDSSMNASHPNSELVWSYNRVEKRSGVLEIPVTVMRYSYGPWNRATRHLPQGKLKKTDLHVCSFSDLKAFVRQGGRSGAPLMNLFMHSYSLLDCDSLLQPTFTHLRPHRRRLRTLESFLEWAVAREDIRIMDCTTFLNEHRQNRLPQFGADFVPEIYSPGTLAYHGFRKASQAFRGQWNRWIWPQTAPEIEIPAFSEEPQP